MDQLSLSKWLKGLIVCVALIGLAVYGGIIPWVGRDIVLDYPEFSHWFYPWLIFLWLTAVPCYAALFSGWKIAGNIGADRSFCTENASYLKHVSVLAAVDSGFFFVGNVVFLFLNMNHPGVVIGSLFVVFVGVCISVAAAALSHLTKKAADLQEQSDLTI